MFFDENIRANASKVRTVLWITFITMLGEIYYGYTTGSMALLADGWHMSTHTAALGITFLAYKIATHPEMVKKFNFGGGKIIALGGFTSSIFLLFVVFLIGFEAISRLIHPKSIQFNEALIVAIIGLIINLVCALILNQTHKATADSPTHNHTHNHTHTHNHIHAEGSDHTPHNHHFHDHNMHGAYLHVVADAMTSVAAIIALLAAKYFGFFYLDPIIGFVGALVILRWAIQLIADTGWELLDGHARTVDFHKLKSQIEANGANIIDLHIWRASPKLLACELIVSSKTHHGVEYYRHILHSHFGIQHSVIEER